MSLNYEMIICLIEKSFFRDELLYGSYCETVKDRLQIEGSFEWLHPNAIAEMLYYPKEIEINAVLENIKLELASLKFMLQRNQDTNTSQLLSVIGEIYVMKRVYAKLRHTNTDRRRSVIIYQMD